VSRTNFDIAALRTFVTGVELGSFAKAANRVALSTSAVSAQIKKLEAQAGTALFRKSGRNLALTEEGEAMFSFARRLIDLNDEAGMSIHSACLDGSVRLGLQEEFGETILPDVLGRFARQHPKVRISARVAGNAELLQRVDSNELDLALLWGSAGSLEAARRAKTHVEQIVEPPMCWIGSKAFPWHADSNDPVPLVAFDRPCRFFSEAIAALDARNIRWRVTFTSQSLAGLSAAVAAGLGLTVRTRYGFGANVRVLDASSLGLPPLPSLPLVLVRNTAIQTAPTERLAAIMVESLRNFLVDEA